MTVMASRTNNNEFITIQTKPGEQEPLRLRNTTNTISALAELVWNAIDADATEIAVEWTENEMMGVESISVKDNGHGIKWQEDSPEEHAFMTVGDSDKHTVVHQSPGGRILHGRFGKGRLRAMALGGQISWKTTFAATPKTRMGYTVGESVIEVSRPKKTKRSTGTTATVKLVSEKGNSLEKEEVTRRFATIFSEHLSLYPSVVISIQGDRLDPAALIKAQRDLGGYLTELDNADKIEWNLRCVQWKKSVADTKGRLYLCDQDRVVITEQELNLRGAEDYTFYLDCERTREWEDDGLMSMRDDAQQVFLAARLEAHRFLRRSFKARAQSLTDELIDQRIYPYSSAPKSELKEAEQKLFSQFALHIKQSIGSYDKMNLDNKRLLFKLLQEVLQNDAGRVVEILNSVLKLTAEDRKALLKLVEKRELAAT